MKLTKKTVAKTSLKPKKANNTKKVELKVHMPLNQCVICNKKTTDLRFGCCFSCGMKGATLGQAKKGLNKLNASNNANGKH